MPAVLLPLFVEVGLTFYLLFRLGPTRVGAINRGEVRAKDVALGQKNWPERALQFANAFDNQFQLPVLFYLATALALITRKADLLFVVLSWAFVASRIVHAVIHTSSNEMRHRFFAYLVGVVALALLWIVLAIEILIGA